MNNVILVAKLIGNIKGNFYIPKYQRGYRWTDTQVKTLLNDLWENCNQETKKEYCLQPVVVRKRADEDYELIDGQQRFTTTLIILSFIKKMFPFVQINYTLEYETRKSTSEFLANINEETAQDNIDFFHIYNANKCIDNWLDENFGDDANRKSMALLELMNYLINKVKVIWYEVGDDEDPIELFTRLNIGRIQLTNAELIKALLLKNYNDDDIDKDKIERSIQWDGIEKELRREKDELWYFLTTKSVSIYPTRIELLFDMMSGKTHNEKERYFTFFWFEHEINARGVKVVWEEIQKNFLQIKEWYTDSLFYHKIGYLISSGYKTMPEIFNLAKDKRKSVFIKELDNLIAESINYNIKEDETYSDLNYKDNYREISNLLLLFNVESIIKEDVYQRFPFSKYNTAEWSLEHIHAQNSQGLKKKETQLEWISMHLDSVKSVSENNQYDSLITEMEDIIKTGQVDARNSFDELFKNVCNALSEDNSTDFVHTISNMALLAKNNNAALNNSTFDVKRNLIVSMDQKGAFIPYCTKMVFLKYYTPSNENQIHFWGQNDRKAYIKAMSEILNPYMSLINKTF
jgi:uncharacterized protein with ParB-like and HNH nuclease domain